MNGSGPSNRLDTLFNAALDLEDKERETFVSKVEKQEPELVAELRRMLADFESADDFFENTPFPNLGDVVEGKSVDDWAAAAAPGLAEGKTLDLELPFGRPMPSAPMPDQIGEYQIERELGKGGMGTVYLAKQFRPERMVAIKLINRHKVSPAFLARFEQEHDVLAMMKHRNIASIHEAGQTMEGDPYFSMEYVEGQPITNYCSDNNLSLRQRMLLFLQVCDGVLHAHQKAIVHRDLKPANIMVCMEGGQPAVKIIDFGIAKDLSVTEGNMTQTGLFMGTPVYMGPEQIESGTGGGDIRSDIYALGVVLYEMLTGLPPIDPEHVSSNSLFDMLKHYKDTEPPLPSKRLEQATEKVDKDFHIELRNDLDWIIMKAMHKNLDRRYQTALGFKQDLEAYLDGKPVEARPPTLKYRLTKFVIRNRIYVAAGALVLFALVGALWVSISAQQRTQQALTRMEATLTFLSGMLSAPDPENAGIDAKVIDILQDAEKELDKEGVDREFEASIRTILGNTYIGLDQRAKAEANLEKALVLRKEEWGDKDRRTLRSQNLLAKTWRNQERWEDAATLFRQTYVLQKSALGPYDEDTFQSLYGLAFACYKQGKYDEAEEYYKNLVQDQVEVLGEMHPDTAITLHALALLYRKKKKYSQAEECYQRTLAIQSEVLAPKHPSAVNTKANFASFLLDRGKLKEAESLYRFVLAVREENFGERHLRTISVRFNLGKCLIDMERFEDAEPLVLQSLDLKIDRHGLEHMSTVRTIGQLGVVIAELGDIEGGIELLQKQADRLTSGGDAELDRLYAMNSLGHYLWKEGRTVEALSVLDQNIIDAQQKKDYSGALWVTNLTLGQLLQSMDRPEEAAVLYCRAWDQISKVQSTSIVQARARYASALIDLKQFEEAEGILIACKRDIEGITHPMRELPTQNLIRLYQAWGKPKKAEDLSSTLVEGK